MEHYFKVEEMTSLVEIQPKAGSSNQDIIKKIEMNLTDGINTVRAEAFGRVAERIWNLVKDYKPEDYKDQMAMVDFTLERREGKAREDGSKTYFMSFKVNDLAFIQKLVKTF